MKQIGEVLKLYKIKETKITNKRQEILSNFVANLNLERVGSGYPPLTGKVVAIKTFHLSEFDLEAFYSMCKDYQRRKGSFSKYFWGALKEQKWNKK